ncbi:hypothetical protein J5N97_001507 [Dioscorea zingiberensis]|uniref:Uncharacterized protein n=1 Tax=Dioscorea zingiberensis TaxID=325984 RepID=A0A9D5H2B3_9LILI|nr:hypothetical protein J5N97_001507 [Dioscorea zingiberensis]
MVAGFPRSLSLPGTLAGKGRPSEKSRHVRSTSLPCPSNPLISHLEDEIRALRASLSHTDPKPHSPASLSSSLDHLDRLLSSVHDLLLLPQSQDSIRRSAAWTDRLLEDSLRLADVYGTFRSEIIALREHQSAAQTAIRRRDEPRLASSVRSLRRAEKDLIRLASSIRDTARSPPPSIGSASNLAEAELIGIARDAMLVVASASESVLLGVAGLSSASTAVRSLWRLTSMSAAPVAKKIGMEDEVWRRRELERLERMEQWMSALETKSEVVFRSLVNIRVSLLNLLTPCL